MDRICHPIQISILKNLLYKPISKFSELNTTKITNDHFTFHLKRLINYGYLEKKQGFYSLTQKGEDFIQKVDLDKEEILKQPLIGVSLFITRDNKKRELEVLLEKRKCDPNKDCFGFHSEKIRQLESFEDAAKRCLFEETRLLGKPFFKGVLRIIRENKSTFFLDIILFFYQIHNPSGCLKKETVKNENTWFSLSEVEKIQNVFPGFDKDLSLLKIKKIFFEERIN